MDDPNTASNSPPPSGGAEPDHVSTPVNPYWKAVIVTSFLFCGTTLAIVMTQFGDPRSPGNIFLRRHGALLAAIEVGAVLVTGVLAMATDQRQTRESPPVSSPNSHPQPSTSEEPPHVG
ncbi:MAG: hypothetical protein U0929_12650 [Planctomycetaceae bacterium]